MSWSTSSVEQDAGDRPGRLVEVAVSASIGPERTGRESHGRRPPGPRGTGRMSLADRHGPPARWCHVMDRPHPPDASRPTRCRRSGAEPSRVPARRARWPAAGSPRPASPRAHRPSPHRPGRTAPRPRRWRERIGRPSAVRRAERCPCVPRARRVGAAQCDAGRRPRRQRGGRGQALPRRRGRRRCRWATSPRTSGWTATPRCSSSPSTRSSTGSMRSRTRSRRSGSTGRGPGRA